MNRPGFTLLEVIVALVVLGLLLVGLSQGLHLGIAAWNKQSEFVARRDQLDTTDRTLRRLITAMDPGSQSQDAPFRGDPGRMDFRTRLPRSVALATRRANASLYVDAQHRLVLAWALAFHEEPASPPPPPTVTPLVDGVARLELGYWRPADATGFAGGWVDRWSSADAPTLIRIRLVFPKGDRRHWPDIIAGPALDATTS